MDSSASNHLLLEPLGAGDLVDRAIRLYRRHFGTLIRIAAPPVVVSTIGAVLITISWREMFVTSESSSLGLYTLMLITGLTLWLGGLLFNMVVMGGAARNLITHLLWNEPVAVKTTYSNVKSRFWGLLFASAIIFIIVGLIFFVILIAYTWTLGLIFAGLALTGILFVPVLAQLVGFLVTLAVTLAALWVFFFLAGKFAYVPQVMLIEGKGIADSIGRSASLASGNAKRLMAMALFAIFASYSAWMILIGLLGWFGYWVGVEVQQMDLWPQWFSISYQVIGQASLILLTPVWMLGLSLLYVDERVRHEGYDIELLAAKRLGDVPKVPKGYINPLTPALHLDEAEMTTQPMQGARPPQRVPQQGMPPNSTLGLR
jgi:hypothetical protein